MKIVLTWMVTLLLSFEALASASSGSTNGRASEKLAHSACEVLKQKKVRYGTSQEYRMYAKYKGGKVSRSVLKAGSDHEAMVQFLCGKETDLIEFFQWEYVRD